MATSVSKSRIAGHTIHSAITLRYEDVIKATYQIRLQPTNGIIGKQIRFDKYNHYFILLS